MVKKVLISIGIFIVLSHEGSLTLIKIGIDCAGCHIL
jgi:hypothetical protein